MTELGIETESPNFQPRVLFIIIAMWSDPAQAWIHSAQWLLLTWVKAFLVTVWSNRQVVSEARDVFSLQSIQETCNLSLLRKLSAGFKHRNFTSIGSQVGSI